MNSFFQSVLLTILVYGIAMTPTSRHLNPYSYAKAPAEVVVPGVTSEKECTDNRTKQRGWKNGRCYNFESTTEHNDQENTQKDTEDMNDDSGKQSSMLGMMAIAAGAAMVAAGMAMVPPNIGLIMAGIALIMAGMAALAAAAAMGKNENKARINDARMSAISGAPTPVAGSKFGKGTGASGIKIDPSLTRTGKANSIFDDFEKKTGISRDDLAAGLMDGKNPAEILGGNGKMGMSSSQLQSMMDKASADGTSLGADDVMNKLGLTPEDMAMYGKNTGMGEGLELPSAGGSSRSPNSTAQSNSFDSMFGAPKGPEGGSAYLGGAGLNLSPDVQAALDRAGITDRSLFQMVNQQYKRKTPMMFGVQPSAPNFSTENNPFSNLGSGGQIDF